MRRAAPDRLHKQGLSAFVLERASFELTDEDVAAFRQRHTPSTSDFPQPPSSTSAHEHEQFKLWELEHPNLLRHFEDFCAAASEKRLAVFLDYDGTLTPIVTNPDRAFMSDQMRHAVKMLAQLFPTAIISGRGREKVEAFVKLKELYYAGSHGMDIVGPRGLDNGGELAFQPAAKFAAVMDTVHDKLVERTAAIAGSSVEHNKFCVSVHFRNCEASAWDSVVAAVQAVLGEHPELKATRGRKVLELRPQVDWHKGTALAHLLKALGLDAEADVLPIYIGDDRTDEDAFEVLAARPQGFGILVSSKRKPTHAKYTLRDPSEVMQFLQRLVAWGATPANAWHQRESCAGWEMTYGKVNGSSIAAAPPSGSVAAADEVTNGLAHTHLEEGISAGHAAPGTSGVGTGGDAAATGSPGQLH